MHITAHQAHMRASNKQKINPQTNSKLTSIQVVSTVMNKIKVKISIKQNQCAPGDIYKINCLF